MRQSARRLTPLLETIKSRPQHYKYTSFRPRSCRRSISSTTTGSTQPPPRPASFWTTSKVFLLSIFVASTVYSASTGFPFDRSKRATSPSGAPVYAKQKDLEKAIEELRELLGDDAVSTDDEDLHAHGYSEWSSVNIDQLPVVVVYPKNTADVSQIAKTATKYKCPMIPYSGGSSLEGNFSAPFGGISVDFAFMDQILVVHPEDMDVVVQPSVQWMALNDAISGTGLFFPVDPGPSAKIGGMVGTNCSGTNAFRYGTMKDWVINLTVVLPDGRVIKTRGRPRKTSAGYNLNGIFIGAEGTLGLVTEVTLKLTAIPEKTRVGVVTFPSIRDAVNTATMIIRSGIPVAAMELLDDIQMGVINKAGGTNRIWEEKTTLFFKFSGTALGVKDNIERVTKITGKNQGGNFTYAKTDQEAHDLWKARKDSLWSMLSLRRDGDEIWSTDVGVPISRLPDVVEEAKREIASLGLFASVVGHVGDGNFHTSVLYNRKDPAERTRVEDVVHHMVSHAIRLEGTCTGEHGVGLGKKGALIEELGLDTVDVMRTLKRSLDPFWLMNPGKIFDAVPQLANVKLEGNSASI